MKKCLPKVVIVGRTNVGKSTLFNRLSHEVKSIAFDADGVTRDLVQETIEWQGRSFDLIDTGGISFKKTKDPIMLQTQKVAHDALTKAELLLFVCDGIVGVLPEDREIAQVVHTLRKPTLLIINKSDSKRVQEQLYEFDQLGFGQTIMISAQHGRGIEELLQAIVDRLPILSRHQEETLSYRLVVLGKPNVGKSSLVNAILGTDRFMVADKPGTTREAISEKIRFYQEDIVITDTPGIRKKRSVQEPLEQLMVKTSFNAVERSNIVVLMIDASQGTIVDQELKLAFYAFEQQHKSVLIIFNKQDILEETHQKSLQQSLEPYKSFLDKVVTLSMSCKTGKNVGKLLPTVEKIWQRATQQFADDKLTLLFKEALKHRPLYKNQQLLHVVSARHIKQGPPTILLKVNQAHLFGDSQRSFFERIMRKEYDLKGVPVRFVVKSANQ